MPGLSHCHLPRHPSPQFDRWWQQEVVGQILIVPSKLSILRRRKRASHILGQAVVSFSTSAVIRRHAETRLCCSGDRLSVGCARIRSNSRGVANLVAPHESRTRCHSEVKGYNVGMADLLWYGRIGHVNSMLKNFIHRARPSRSYDWPMHLPRVKGKLS